MPLPKPRPNETQDQFMGRCMGDPTAMADFPKQDQRLAVCFSRWRDRNKMDMPDGMLPEPLPTESQDAFMGRCMINPDLMQNFPSSNERNAVCLAQWLDAEVEAANCMGGKVLKTFAAPASNDPLEYVMSDERVDRIGDIIEQKGWQLQDFKNNPIAFFNHNSDFPIGNWTNVRVEGGQLKGRLNLPPPESERQRELQGFVKAGVLRAVSVGFSAIEAEPIKGGGLRFKKQELLECSLVGVPAHAQALQVAKSIGASEEVRSLIFGEAATGRTKPVVSGVSKSISLKGKVMAKKTLAEQISAMESARSAKSARMEAIQEKASEEDRTKDEAEREEFDNIADEIESIDKELKDLNRLERAMVITAKPVAGHNSKAGDESRELSSGTRVSHMQRQLPPGIAFARYVRCCIASGGIPISALHIAEKQYPDMDDLHTILRAAVAAGSTSADAFAGSLVQYTNLVGEFVEFLRPMTVLGRIPGLRRVPFNVRIPRQTSGGSAYWVGEGQPKPLTTMALDTITLRWKKLANIAVLTDEVTRFSNPAIDALVRDDLARAIAQEEDTAFLSPSNAGTTDVKPASITNGVTPVASSGTDADAVRADFVALVSKFIVNNQGSSGLVFVGNETTAAVMSAMFNTLGTPEFPGMTPGGGRVMGYEFITSQNQPSSGSPATSIIVALRPGDIFLADDGPVTVDASREASLQMLDNPTNATMSGSPSAPTATTMVSMFQTNSVAIRAERYIDWVKGRSTAVEYLSGVAYAL